MVPDADLRIKLPVFEGPLDLLLFLIRKNELDIYDIPIATVTRQYIEVLRSMQQLDLEIAGEFFVMAASLMEIKSRMLLPRGQAATGESEDDDPLDPRWELVHQLLQYKKFKEAAAKLDELAAFQRDMLARHVVEVVATENERPLKPVDRIEVWNVFNLVLRRLAEKLVVGEIKGEEVTVSDKMEELLGIIQTRKKFLFTDLFENQAVTVRVLVATFIAVLELTRLKKLRIRQDEAYTDIYVEAVDDTPNADGSPVAGTLNFSPEAPDHGRPTTPLPLFQDIPLSEPTNAAALASTNEDASPPDESAAPDTSSENEATSPVAYAAIPTVLAAPSSGELPPTPAEEAPVSAFEDTVAPSPAPPDLAPILASEPAASAEPAELVPPPTDEPGPAAASASEPAPPAPSGGAPAVAEQIPPENPLDTEPPRNTLAS